MKTITVITNDSKTPESTLTVSGDVEKFANITPSVIRFNAKIGEEVKSEVKIVPESKFPFSILKIRSQEEKVKNIKYELKEEKSASGTKEYSILVENLKKDAGFYYDVLILETDSKIQPEIKINVMGRIIDPNEQNKAPLHGINENSGDKNQNATQKNSFLEAIQKMQQQNSQQQLDKSNGVEDPKKAEELKKKFEALIKQAQEEKKKAETNEKQTNEAKASKP